MLRTYRCGACRFPFLMSPAGACEQDRSERSRDMAPGRPGFLSRCSGSWNLDSRPGADVALMVGIVSRTDDRAVGAQAKGVSGTRRHRHDVLPVADVTLPAAVVSGCEDTSGRRDPDGVIAARSQRHHLFPLTDVARWARRRTTPARPMPSSAAAPTRHSVIRACQRSATFQKLTSGKPASGPGKPKPGSDGTMTSNASAGSPPNAAGSASGSTTFDQCQNVHGQPWVRISGTGRGPRPDLRMKCTGTPATRTW